jgi:chaperone BCS1
MFASTNYIDKLDEALRRPGRFDVHIAFDYAVHQQAADLYKHFYPLSRVLSTGPEQISLDEKAVNPTQLHYYTEDDLNEAADQFAESTIGKGIKVSIATMQGYLLLHKKDPRMALDKAGDWADKILKEQTVAPEAAQPAPGAQVPTQ